MGSSEATSMVSSVSSPSSSPNPSIAAPKAAAKGSPLLTSVAIDAEIFVCSDLLGFGFASIRKSLVNGPNSKLLEPESVL
ncbi:MAG: hypothetical protein CMA40_04755 [Euryarchaeota archaeon]|nr:hypothetical protein [Euryarchaeota archaeon]